MKRYIKVFIFIFSEKVYGIGFKLQKIAKIKVLLWLYLNLYCIQTHDKLINLLSN